MPNIKAEIQGHNKNTLEKAQQKHPDTQLCNCPNKKQCPLDGQCLTEEYCLPSKYHGKQHLKFTMVTTKNRLRNNVRKTIRNYPRSVGR